MKNFTFGMKELRVTQNWESTYSHKPHWYGSKNYADYPIDIGGKDGGRDIYYAPVDMKVNNIFGVGKVYTNTIWLETTDKVKTPSGEFKVFIALIHWNDNDPYISKLKVGSIVKAGQPICEEGIDGATTNHLHLVCGNAERGTGNKLIENSNGKWVSNGYCMKPEEIMYLDKKFTKVTETGGLNWQEAPKDNFFEDTTKGYYGKGDWSKHIENVNKFLYERGLSGNKIGDYAEANIKVFQKQNGLEVDGNIGPKTYAKLVEKGFKE